MNAAELVGMATVAMATEVGHLSVQMRLSH